MSAPERPPDLVADLLLALARERPAVADHVGEGRDHVAGLDGLEPGRGDRHPGHRRQQRTQDRVLLRRPTRQPGRDPAARPGRLQRRRRPRAPTAPAPDARAGSRPPAPRGAAGYRRALGPRRARPGLGTRMPQRGDRLLSHRDDHDPPAARQLEQHPAPLVEGEVAAQVRPLAHQPRHPDVARCFAPRRPRRSAGRRRPGGRRRGRRRRARPRAPPARSSCRSPRGRSASRPQHPLEGRHRPAGARRGDDVGVGQQHQRRAGAGARRSARPG